MQPSWFRLLVGVGGVACRLARVAVKTFVDGRLAAHYTHT